MINLLPTLRPPTTTDGDELTGKVPSLQWQINHIHLERGSFQAEILNCPWSDM